MDELSADAREILAEMRRADTSQEAARDRVRRRLSVSLAATSISVAGSAAAARSATTGLAHAGAHAAVGSGVVASVSVAKLALLVVVGAASGSALLAPVALLREAPHSPPKHVEAPAARSLPVNPVTQRSVPKSTSTPNASPDPVAPPRGRVAPPASSRIEAEPAAPRALGSLSRETRSLESVREHLRAGQAAQAIALLDQHERTYPSGALREEAAASRVFALCAEGLTNQARAAATRFHATFPRSPLGPRVERACANPSSL